MICEKDHDKHGIITYGKLMPNDNELKKKKEELKILISKLNDDIKDIINMLNSVINNLQIYYKIYEDAYNNYDNKNLYYNILHNINEFNKNNDCIIQDLNKIINDNNINNKFKIISDIYHKMNTKQYNEIEMIYEIKNKKKIKILDSTFVSHNKNNCKIIYKDKEYELKDTFKINDENKDDKYLKIKLKGIKNITNAYSMFGCCTQLISLPDINNWDTSKVTNMFGMFFGCESLKNIGDISTWDTSNVTDISTMFSGCKSLESIPDISKWNLSKAKNKSNMFKGCKASNIPKEFKSYSFF